MNRSGNIGTAGETAVVRVMQRSGWPNAERRRMRGNLDAGDLTGVPGLCVEVKAGEKAASASDLMIESWLRQTETERVNSGADLGFLVVKRRGIGYANADRWWAIVPLITLINLVETLPPMSPAAVGRFPVRMILREFLILLAANGYGDGARIVREAVPVP